MSHYHGNKISGCQHPFLKWKNNKREKNMGYCFVPECNL